MSDRLNLVAKKPKALNGESKKPTISVKIDDDVLKRLDAYCERQIVPLARSAFVNVAVKRLLDELEAKEASE